MHVWILSEWKALHLGGSPFGLNFSVLRYSEYLNYNKNKPFLILGRTLTGSPARNSQNN